jgi:hypothetical protein
MAKAKGKIAVEQAKAQLEGQENEKEFQRDVIKEEMKEVSIQ